MFHIIPLPVDWSRICGRVGNHYRMAFNLRYFDQFNDRELKARLQASRKKFVMDIIRIKAASIIGLYLTIQKLSLQK